MVMRYYYGLGVGHLYAHAGTSTGTSQCATGDLAPMETELEVYEGPDSDSQDVVGSVPEVHGSEQPSLLDEDEYLEDEYLEDECSDSSCSDPSDDEEFYEMSTMYAS